MENDKKHQQFTQAQLEELRFGDMMDVLPGVGVLAMGGRKVLPEILEAVAPHVKKAGLAIKEAFVEIKNHYIEKQAAQEAVEVSSIKVLREELKPLARVYEEGVDAKKLAPVALEKTKGADLFVNNEHDLFDYLGEKSFRKYAHLAVDDEKIYRETLSVPNRILRAIKYDNINPELGTDVPYILAPLRIGGSNNTILATATAQTASDEMKIMALSYLRGTVQTGGVLWAADATLPKAFETIQGVFKNGADLTKENKSTTVPEPRFDERQNGLDGLASEQKIAQINQQISQFSAHQQQVILEQVAAYLNKIGMHIKQVEPEPQLGH
jgi:hypothetical protein